MTAKKPAKYLAIDLETTGLDHIDDVILEIAAVVLDEDLEQIDHPFIVRLACSPAKLASMQPVVIDMHLKTGLVARNSDGLLHVVGGVNPKTVLEAFAAYIITNTPEGKSLELTGCGVHFDRKFLEQWTGSNMYRNEYQALWSCISHRHFDSRTAQSLLPAGVKIERRPDEVEHSARGDVLYSVRVLKMVRHLVACGVDERWCALDLDLPEPEGARARVAAKLGLDGAQDEIERMLGVDKTEGQDAPSEDTADAYTEAVENGTPSTPVALADDARDVGILAMERAMNEDAEWGSGS